MTQEPFDYLNTLADGLARSRRRAAKTPPKKKTEKGIPWQAKVIDGAYYVPLSQVADLLEANDVLPNVRAGIGARVRAQAERKAMGL